MMSNDELPQIQVPYSTTTTTNPNPNPNPLKRKRRSLPGTPDPDAEVIALSPNSLMATNRFICEICNKGFKRDQNLQLHRRGHNLPWKLKKKNKGEVIRKKVFICPEKTCVHHDSSRALGDLTGIKKHYSRKHGEKKWKCDKCSKKYAVMSDWKAHAKICGTREYKCDCGTLFSRKDSFITHRAFCDALVEESSRFFTAPIPSMSLNCRDQMDMQNGGNWSFNGVFRPEFGGFEPENQQNRFPLWLENNANGNPGPSRGNGNNWMVSEELAQIGCVNQWLSRGQEESFVGGGVLKEEDKEEENKRSLSESISSLLYHSSNNNNDNNNNNQIHYSPVPMSATALLQRAAQIGSLNTSFNRSRNEEGHQDGSSLSLTQMGTENIKNVNLSGVEGEGSLTRDFLGVGGKVNSQDFFSSMMEMRQYNRND